MCQGRSVGRGVGVCIGKGDAGWNIVIVGIGEGDGDGVGLGGVCADAPRVDAPATTMAATARERNHCFIERSY